MITLKTKDILFFGVNLVTFLFALSYTILYSMGMMAMQYAEKISPLDESGIFVFLTFGRIFFILGLFCVIGLDFVMLFDKLKEYYKDKNKGWL